MLIGQSVLARGSSGMLDPLWPILATTFLTFTTATYSSMVSTVDLVMAVVSIGIGSFLTTRFGPKRASIMVYLLYTALALFIWLGSSLWLATTVFIAITVVYSVTGTLASICTNPLRMQLSDPQVAATQFTIYNSISNLPVSFGAMMFAWLGGAEDLPLVMGIGASMFVAAALVMSLIRMD